MSIPCHMSYKVSLDTLYTGKYEPLRLVASYFWPGALWIRSLAAFEEGELVVSYPPAGG